MAGCIPVIPRALVVDRLPNLVYLILIRVAILLHAKSVPPLNTVTTTLNRE